MEFLGIKKDIPFMGHALIFNVISALTFVAAVFFLVYKGLHVSIEFVGGTLIEVTYSKPADLERVRKTIEELGYTESQVQSFGTAQDALIRLPAQKGVDTAQQCQEVPAALEKQDQDVKLQPVEFTGPHVGNELAHDGLMALAVVVIGIMGFFAFFQREFSLTVLAAVLAVLGYFVSETVLVFDRVCETFRDRRFNKLSIAEIMIHAITRTTSRTIIIHGSSLMMVL